MAAGFRSVQLLNEAVTAIARRGELRAGLHPSTLGMRTAYSSAISEEGVME
jgi:hypothetical protein